MNEHLKLALASIQCFTDDGELDVGELNYLLGLAKADGEIDPEEVRVLRNIIQRALKSPVAPHVADRMREILDELAAV